MKRLIFSLHANQKQGKKDAFTLQGIPFIAKMVKLSKISMCNLIVSYL